MDDEKTPTPYEVFFTSDGTHGKIGSTPIHFDELKICEGKPEPKYRETRFEYSGRIGNVEKSLKVETYLTFKELRKLCADVMGA